MTAIHATHHRIGFSRYVDCYCKCTSFVCDLFEKCSARNVATNTHRKLHMHPSWDIDRYWKHYLNQNIQDVRKHCQYLSFYCCCSNTTKLNKLFVWQNTKKCRSSGIFCRCLISFFCSLTHTCDSRHIAGCTIYILKEKGISERTFQTKLRIKHYFIAHTFQSVSFMCFVQCPRVKIV